MDHLERKKYLQAELKHQKELINYLYLNSKNSGFIDHDEISKSTNFKIRVCDDIEAEILILEHAY